MRPPKLFHGFFKWYCKPRLLDRIEGDLLEIYSDRVRRFGKPRADLRFIVDVILLLRPAIIRPIGLHQYQINTGMFKNYLSVAWRNILRSKTFSFVNIGGLSLGIMCSLLILLWINDELNVDKFNSKPDVYSVYERVFSEGKVDAGPWTPGELAAELKQQIPEIKYASGFWINNGETLFSVEDKKISYKGVAADSDFFKIFNYGLLKGSAENALKDPDAIAISRRMAEVFFGSPEAAYGSTIRMNNEKDFTITAVFENVPDNASQQFEFVGNWKDLLESVTWLKIWIYRGPLTFIQLHPGTDRGKVEAKIRDFLTSFLTASGEGYRTELGLQPYNEMYLHSNFANGVPNGGRIEYVQLFALIALFILMIACINFMNLSTARSVKRAKEVGVRKVMGAFRSSLISQFIGEAMLLTGLAVILATVCASLLLPWFNLLSDKHIVLPITSVSFWASLIGLTLITACIAGAYPAFFLSSLNSIKVLKGSLKSNARSLMFRKALVVFQFILVIAFIAGTTVISRQVDFMQSKNLGFDRDHLIYIPLQGHLFEKYEAFRERLLTQPGIQMVTRSTNAPSSINTHEYDLSWEGKNADDKVVAIHNGIGYDFVPMMNIQVLQGRNFSRDFVSDSTVFIINETALKTIGYDDPIGKPLDFFQRRGTIVGVVKDFHLKSLREPIMPLVMFLGEKANWGYVLIKTQPGMTQEAIAGIEDVFKKIEPEFPLRYNFADEEFHKLYNSERTVNQLSISFSMLAIAIACLGLFGLTMFTAEQRRKEIGIRKAIGATTLSIVTMLSNDVLKLVLVSAVFATPVAWFAMNKWLVQFAYQAQLSWWLFAAPALLTLLIALITTSFQAVKAGMADPVKSLRSE
jgi:putative ABC transport system permease protein